MGERDNARPLPGERPLVALSQVAKTYPNGTVALADVTLAVRAHEFLSLLGPSGCGKSTVLRLIAGLGALTGGRIEWNVDGTGARIGPRNIGFVFQEPTLMPWASVRDNVRLPLRLAHRGGREAAERVERAIASVGLEAFERAYPRELSGGMRMRVSIARALATGATLLLMDEPFAALDEITRFRLNNDLLELWARERLTVIFVTHSVYESVYLSSRILVMTPRPGRIAGEIAIPAAYPRGDEFRTSAAYNELCRTVSAALKSAMGG